MTLSTQRHSIRTLYALLVILWSIECGRAFSPTSSSPRCQHSQDRILESHRRRTSTTSLHARPSKPTASSVTVNATSPTVDSRNAPTTSAEPTKILMDPSPPTTANANATTQNNNNNNNNSQHYNPLARLQEFRARHTDDKNLSQEPCDSMLAWCVAHDEWDQVLDVLDIMKARGLSQVRSTYRSCLQACFERPNAASAEEILTAMDQAGFPPNATDVALAVATMCRQEKREKGWWQRALHLIQATPDNLPVPAYNAVLSCMTDDRQWKEAVRLLRSMEQRSVQPALSTYRYVIECCAASNQAEQAVQTLQSCVRQGLTPTVYSFELVIGALSRQMQWRRAVQLMDLMDELKIQKTIVIYNTVLSALSKAREVVQAKNLLVQMRKNGIQPNVISYNAVLSACASTSRWKDAMSVLDQLHRAPGVSPDIYSYTNVIRACTKGGKTSKALTLFQVAKDKGLPVDAYCYTAAIDACSKAKLWKRALELLNEMEARGVPPSDVTFSVTISALGNGGQWSKALDLLDLMRRKGMTINLITYNSAITALSKAAKQSSRSQFGKGELWTKVMELLGQMKADGIEPDGFSFSSAISCCGAEGRWEEALQLVEIMQKGGPRMRPNKIAYTAAIASCGRSGEVEHALGLFRQMKDQGLAADRVAYNAVFSALRVAGKADLAEELWAEMCGTKQTNTAAIATARFDKSTTPDIITVSDAVAAMSSDDSTKGRARVDRVFAEAVMRGICLRKDTLDSQSEFDLSGMAFPVARAACRYIVNQVLASRDIDRGFTDLTFITGIGASRSHRQTPNGKVDDGTSAESNHTTSLREYVQEILSSDYDPPIMSCVPQRAQGVVQIKGTTLEECSQLKKS